MYLLFTYYHVSLITLVYMQCAYCYTYFYNNMYRHVYVFLSIFIKYNTVIIIFIMYLQKDILVLLDCR